MTLYTDDGTQYDGIDNQQVAKMMVGVGSLAAAMDVDPVTIRRWSKNGTMPVAIKVGGRSLWDAHRIRQWISDGCPRVGE